MWEGGKEKRRGGKEERGVFGKRSGGGGGGGEGGGGGGVGGSCGECLWSVVRGGKSCCGMWLLSLSLTLSLPLSLSLFFFLFFSIIVHFPFFSPPLYCLVIASPYLSRHSHRRKHVPYLGIHNRRRKRRRRRRRRRRKRRRKKSHLTLSFPRYYSLYCFLPRLISYLPVITLPLLN